MSRNAPASIAGSLTGRSPSRNATFANGGNIALEAYAAHPARVAGIVFVGSYATGSQIIAAGNRPEMIRAAVSTATARIAFYTSVGIPEAIAMEARYGKAQRGAFRRMRST
ncbi:MAG: hypothetical protein HYX63_16145 [Gammaproteobacteria bacterium]|nr:hypothetical protein [Gammaproteobacteria bacterium]